MKDFQLACDQIPRLANNQLSPCTHGITPGITDTTKPVRQQQIGGSHYTDMAIQPITYIFANKLGFVEGNVVSYVSRWRVKGGIKDLKKAHHHLALLIEEAEAQQATGVKFGI
jgi:hypothetical protein